MSQSDLNEAFERVVNSDRRLLTTRQQLWIAFKAGADHVLSSIRPATETPIKHELNRRHTDQGIESVITPACSCGWVGRGYAAWNDYQHTMVKDQEDEHMVAAQRAEKAATGLVNA